MLVKVAPRDTCSRNPEYAIQNKAMVPWPPTTARTAFDHERLKPAPFFIAHQTTDQGRLPKATLNQILPLLGIPFVNTPWPRFIQPYRYNRGDSVTDDKKIAAAGISKPCDHL